MESLYVTLMKNSPFRIHTLDGCLLMEQSKEHRVPISKKRGVILCSILKDAPKDMKHIYSVNGEITISSNDRFMCAIKTLKGRYEIFEADGCLAFVEK